MNDPQPDTNPLALPDDPAMAASDPGMFAPLASDETNVLHAHLRSGWEKQHVLYPTLSEPWKETSAVLDDLDQAWWLRWHAEQEPEAGT